MISEYRRSADRKKLIDIKDLTFRQEIGRRRTEQKK